MTASLGAQDHSGAGVAHPDGAAQGDDIDRRVVRLRDERDGRDVRILDARLDRHGNLLIEGQDLGPGTAPISDDGEVEWTTTITRFDVVWLLTWLEAPRDADVLDVLRDWTGMRSYDVERIIRDHVPHTRSVW